MLFLQQMFPHIAEASNNGVKAYDVNIPHRALAMYVIVNAPKLQLERRLSY